jgi:hypothetical protein
MSAAKADFIPKRTRSIGSTSPVTSPALGDEYTLPRRNHMMIPPSAKHRIWPNDVMRLGFAVDRVAQPFFTHTNSYPLGATD